MTLGTDTLWVSKLKVDETTNDNDKTFTVPTYRQFRIISVWVELTTTGTAGSRQIDVEFHDDSGDVIGRVASGVTTGQNETTSYYFADGLTADTAKNDGIVMVPLPASIVLPAGYQLRVFDTQDIDANDDMIVQCLVQGRAEF